MALEYKTAAKSLRTLDGLVREEAQMNHDGTQILSIVHYIMLSMKLVINGEQGLPR
jgi:hypothetical protein